MRQSSLYALSVTLTVVIGATLGMVIGAGEAAEICKDGRIAGYLLASQIDGSAAARSGGKTVAIGAEYQSFERLAVVARSSRFKVVYVPLRIEAACKSTVLNGKPGILINAIEQLAPVSDVRTFDGIYADFGIEPVAL